MKRLMTVGLALLWLLPSGCAVQTEKQNYVGAHIKPVVNGLPQAGEKLSKYCTAYNPDPSLHQHTIADLVASNTPFVLVFGTPSHCTQCQNQLDTVRHYRDIYHNAFEVVHIDQYKNAHIYTQLGVSGDPWTFMIDGQGVIQGVFPGVTTWDNLDKVFERMLAAAPTPPVA